MKEGVEGERKTDKREVMLNHVYLQKCSESSVAWNTRAALAIWLV